MTAREGAIGLLLVGSAVACVLVASPGARVSVVVLSFAAGVAFERYRQAHRERSLPLEETPAPWRRRLAESVDGRYALAAAIAVAAALAMLLLPSAIRTHDSTSRPSARVASPGPGPAPRVRILDRRQNIAFVVRGARFRVFLADHKLWARQLRRTPPGRGSRWVTVGVTGTNLGRRRFNPNRLRYRLLDSRGRTFVADTGGTGPGSLAETGHLRRGQTAETQLGFRVPKVSKEYRLVFEPTQDGARQAQVRLRSG